MASIASIKPIVGMGVTECMWTDRKAGTITRVSDSGKTIWYTHDKCMRIDKSGMSDVQYYAYEQDLNGHEKRASLRKDGYYRSSGDNNKIVVGFRKAYHDYSF